MLRILSFSYLGRAFVKLGPRYQTVRFQPPDWLFNRVPGFPERQCWKAKGLALDLCVAATRKWQMKHLRTASKEHGE